jgi:DNA-binding CsgD family transcriptional regulator
VADQHSRVKYGPGWDNTFSALRWRANAAVPPRARRSALQSLSAREFDIFRMIADGKSVAEIAETLNLSTTTVSNYYYLIKSKLGVASDVELVHLALRARGRRGVMGGAVRPAPARDASAPSPNQSVMRSVQPNANLGAVHSALMNRLRFRAPVRVHWSE